MRKRRSTISSQPPPRPLLTSWRGLVFAIAVALLLSLWLGNREPGFADLAGNPALSAALAETTSPATGPARGTATLLVYTDYRCPNCRIDGAALDSFAADHPSIRIVYKDWPVLGPQSVAAARVALAAQRQGRYHPVHAALMAAPSLDPAGIRAAAVGAGADWERLVADLAIHGGAIDARLARIGREATALGLPGTPSYVSGGQRAAGRIGAAGLVRLVAAGR